MTTGDFQSIGIKSPSTDERVHSLSSTENRINGDPLPIFKKFKDEGAGFTKSLRGAKAELLRKYQENMYQKKDKEAADYYQDILKKFNEKDKGDLENFFNRNV